MFKGIFGRSSIQSPISNRNTNPMNHMNNSYETIYLAEIGLVPVYSLPTIKTVSKRRNWFCRKILRMDEYAKHFEINGSPEFSPVTLTIPTEVEECKSWMKSVYIGDCGIPSLYKKNIVYKIDDKNVVKLHGAFPIDITSNDVTFCYDYYTVNEEDYNNDKYVRS